MMRRIFKIGLVVLLIVAVGFLGLAVMGYRMVTRSLPKTKGEIVLPGLETEVRVYRDGYHVPHVLAQDEHDLFFAQGFVTAQDRIWQMDLWRRIADGRLSEILGRSTLKTDSLMLTVGIGRTARRIAQSLSPESRRVYQAYANGVNAYLRTHEARLPVECTLLDYRPAPWEVEDCVAVLRLMGWWLGFGWYVDATLGGVVDRVGMEKAQAVFPSFPADVPRTVPWGEPRITVLFREVRSLRDGVFSRFESGRGTNCWAVSGERSVTGKPILANDPHLPFSNPSLWYEIHLVGDGFDVAGFSLPGLPLVVIGHNRKIAWGMANMMADDQDLFVERLDPGDSTTTVYGGVTRPVEVIDEAIPVRNGEPVRVRILRTHHGPLVSGVLPQRGVTWPAFALAWSGFAVSDEGLAFYRVNRAVDWSSFRDALRHFQVPCLNFVYADREGNIGFQAAGRIPVRSRGACFLPRPGNDPAYDWKGTIPYDALPSVMNPEEGFVALANNPIVGEDYPTTISDLWAHPARIQRIRQLLSEKARFSAADFQRMQADVLSPFAAELMALVLPVLEKTASDDAWMETLRGTLVGWDGQMKAGSAQAAFFEVFLSRLLANLLEDEMGDSLYAAYASLHAVPLIALDRLVRMEDSPWFDDVTTDGVVEGRQDIVWKSFSEAADSLKQRLGEDVSGWSWGALHTLVFEHPLGEHPLLGPAFNLGPFHVGGSGTTVNCTGRDLSDTYGVVWGASARLIVDLDNFDNSVSVLPTGQSGQPMDDHYRDQAPLWLTGRYHPMITDTVKIVRSRWDLLRLQSGVSDG